LRVEDRLALEVSVGESPALSEVVGCGQARHFPLAAQEHHAQTGLVERAPEVADVGATVPQGRVLFPPMQAKQVDLDLGMDPGEGTDRPGHLQPRRERDDESLRTAIDLMDTSEGGIDGDEHPACLLEQLLAGGGELDAARCPYQQCAPELLLERLDLPAQHGLGDVELLGGPTEVAKLGHGGEVTQLAQVKIHAPKVSVRAKRYWTQLRNAPRIDNMIVITTPTGDIGSQVLRDLLEAAPTAGEKLRVIVRDPSRLSDSIRDRVDVVVGSHRDADVVGPAFSGADAVFWVVAPDRRAPSLEDAFSGFTQAAAEAFAAQGVEHVVGVSALGRGTAVAGRAGLVTASLAMDDLIAGTGVAYRALANPSFMDNLLREVASIRDAGVFTGTIPPEQKAPTTATRDIAAVASRLLLDRSWTGTGSVAVLGPEDLSPAGMAEIMSKVLGKSVRYEHESLENLGATLARYGVGEAFVQGVVQMMQAKQEGLDAGVARTPETASPTTFRQWCEEVLKPAVLA
jgi:uncharacterized protein YbjT (DUF2867 family)